MQLVLLAHLPMQISWFGVLKCIREDGIRECKTTRMGRQLFFGVWWLDLSSSRQRENAAQLSYGSCVLVYPQVKRDIAEASEREWA